ncbi:ATP synthase f chain, mitochondrial precursor [Microsporum canis]
MSFIVRRGISTLIPPKIASPSVRIPDRSSPQLSVVPFDAVFRREAIGAAKDAARMERVSDFYARLPRGPAPEVKPTGIFARYQAAYFGKNASSAPLVHLIVGLTLLGYSIQYVTHLREFPCLSFLHSEIAQVV